MYHNVIHWLQSNNTPAHCDTLISCALEIFLLTYLLTYLLSYNHSVNLLYEESFGIQLFGSHLCLK